MTNAVAQPDEPAIEARGLVRKYGEVTAVASLDLSVSRGQIYGFLGPNGAGKTTVVRMLCTLLAPSGGKAFVAGRDVAHEAEAVRMRIGVALQEAALDPDQSGRELLNLQARLFAVPKQTAKTRVAELIELVDLSDAIDRRVKTYSGGMRRRLDLALALVHDPEILFLDEPTTGLDPVSRRQIWTEVRNLNAERGLTVFLTTQYLEEADELADAVGIMANGELVAQGTPEELKRQVGQDVIVVRVDNLDAINSATLMRLEPVSRVEKSGDELRLAVTNGPAAIPVVAAALSENPDITVREIALRQATLDDAFFALTGHGILQ
jgi:ABC-2 type transport system ATP-binding protein